MRLASIASCRNSVARALPDRCGGQALPSLCKAALAYRNGAAALRRHYAAKGIAGLSTHLHFYVHGAPHVIAQRRLLQDHRFASRMVRAFVTASSLTGSAKNHTKARCLPVRNGVRRESRCTLRHQSYGPRRHSSRSRWRVFARSSPSVSNTILARSRLRIQARCKPRIGQIHPARYIRWGLMCAIECMSSSDYAAGI